MVKINMLVGNDRAISVSNPEFWESMYKAGKMPWDLRGPVPALEEFLSSPYAVSKGKIAVLGCGAGHDCMSFASRGFEVTGIDFAPSAIKSTYEKYLQAGIAGTAGFLLQRDLFDIHEYDGYFDYVFEHNCFSSIAPHRRQTYARTVRDLLKVGGKLIAIWWIFDRPGGPPFSVSRDELFKFFGEFFTFDITFTPSTFAAGRQGKELFCLMTRK
jgi:SAM-dependent methyltransferase